MSDIIVQIEEGLGIIGCVVVTEGRLFHFERLGEGVVQRGGEVLDSLLQD